MTSLLFAYIKSNFWYDGQRWQYENVGHFGTPNFQYATELKRAKMLNTTTI